MKRLITVVILFQALALTAKNRDAVVDIRVKIKVDGTGRAQRDIRITKHILSDWAIDKLSDPKIRFDSSRQTLTLLKADTTTPDNRVIRSRKAARNLSTPPSLAKAPELTGHQELVVTMLGIEQGCRTDLEYRINDKKPLPFGRIWRFPLPVNQDIHSMDVSVESRLPVAWVLVNSRPLIRPKVTNSAGHLRLQWSNVAPIKGQQPTLILYLKGKDKVGWQDTQTCPRMGTVLKKALKNNGISKILAVSKAIKAAVRITPLPKGLFADDPRPACEVLNTGYATPMEAALLLNKAMKQAGLSSEIVFLGPVNALPSNARTTWAMNKVGVKVSGSLLIGVPRFKVLNSERALDGHRFITNQGFGASNTTNCGHGRVRQLDLDISVDKKQGFTGSIHTLIKRDGPLFVALVKDPKKAVKGLVSGVLPGAKTQGYTVMNLSGSSVELSIRIKGRLKGDKQGILLKLPDVSRVFRQVVTADQPFRVGDTRCMSLNLRVNYPSGWQLVSPVVKTKASSSQGVFKYRLSHTKGGFTLNVTARLLRAIIAPDAPLTDVARQALSPALWRVILIPRQE